MLQRVPQRNKYNRLIMRISSTLCTHWKELWHCKEVSEPTGEIKCANWWDGGVMGRFLEDRWEDVDWAMAAGWGILTPPFIMRFTPDCRNYHTALECRCTQSHAGRQAQWLYNAATIPRLTPSLPSRGYDEDGYVNPYTFFPSCMYKWYWCTY